MRQFSIALLLIFAVSACKSVDKLYDEGDFGQVISKLDGKAKRNNLDRRERSLFVRAANNYFKAEGEKVLASSNSTNYKDWKNAKQKLQRLQKEYDKIAGYEQVREDDVDVTELNNLVSQIDQKLFDFTMEQYQIEIDDYLKTNDRDYAIRAYNFVGDLEDYGADPVFMDSLYEQAITLGHRFIAVDFDTDVFNNWEFNRQFKDEIDFRNDDFNTFTDGVNDDSDYRLVIGAEIYNKDEDRDNSYRNYSDQVVDYYETSIDTSTNQEIKTPVYKQIEATVERIEYSWIVEGRAGYVIYDLNADRRYDSDNFSTIAEERRVEHVLDSGDEDAVPSNITLDRRETRFYNYDDLIEACFEQLAEEFNKRANIKRKLE